MLWAALLVVSLPRHDSIMHLSAVAKAAMKFRDRPEVYPQHTSAARISATEFDEVFADVLAKPQVRKILSPLLLLDELPDRNHWKSHLPEPESENGWAALAAAVAQCMDRRARQAIDIRCLRVMFLALQHRLLLQKGISEDIVDMFCAYPEQNDPNPEADAVIVSMEGITAHGPDASDSTNWSNAFWRECLRKTRCIPANLKAPDSGFEYEPAKKRWGEIYGGLFRHFFTTLTTTAVDPKHDAVFGLALYAMSLMTGMMRPHSTRPSGRHLLRSLAEVQITLAYLSEKDDEKHWRMYRSHGTGQAKLAFLKLVEHERGDLPKHVDLRILEDLANADAWQEFVPIDLGQWANLTVRKMAEEAGIKSIYDAYYVWPSGFVHGHWGAVRDSVFDICASPLHRFHRIPRPMRTDMSDVCFDAVELVNRVLESVNRCYPSFTPRFDSPSISPELSDDKSGSK